MTFRLSRHCPAPDSLSNPKKMRVGVVTHHVFCLRETSPHHVSAPSFQPCCNFNPTKPSKFSSGVFKVSTKSAHHDRDWPQFSSIVSLTPTQPSAVSPLPPQPTAIMSASASHRPGDAPSETASSSTDQTKPAG